MSLPAVLVCGFLGSGKTTFLRSMARGRRLAFLVNEFSPIDVDGRLLEPHGKVVGVTGGSIFCTCRVGEFLDRVGQVLEVPGIDGLAIEASGMADPTAFRSLLAETSLAERVDVRQVIAIVDPHSVVKLVHTLPAIAAQLRAADRVLINKTDLATSAELEAAESAVRQIAPVAKIERVSYVSVDWDPFEAIPAAGCEQGSLTDCEHVDYISRVHRFECADRAELDSRLGRLGDWLRLKGDVRVEGVWMHVEGTPAGIEVLPGEPGQTSELVVISPKSRLRVM